MWKQFAGLQGCAPSLSLEGTVASQYQSLKTWASVINTIMLLTTAPSWMLLAESPSYG